MTTHSGDTSPGGSNSMSDSSVRTQTSEESQVIPHKAFHLDCYNSSPDQDDDESDGQCDDETLSQLMLHSDLLRPRTSIGVQTDHNEDFPPLKFLQALIGEDHNNTAAGFLNQQQLYYSSGGGGGGGSEVPHPQQTPSSQLPNIPTTNLSTAATATTPTTPITTATAINTTTTAIDASSSSTDGTLQLVIQNFRHMSDTVRGPCKYIQNVPWRIMVMPRQHVVQKKGTQKCLGFFLQCCPDAYSESWSCQASAELRLISQKTGIPNFIRKTNHVYTAKENDWGYSCFMTWADILDESQGYIKDDKVTLEVQVKADTPKNILTHSEFKKKIQDYKRLADMQCQRGLIDKAIECNTQALKFCKDKDQQCKAELEAQKAHLIEMKLKQSIQRIEKGNDGNKLEDDSTTNLNALRQALGTSTRCNAAAKGSTSSAAATTKNKSTSTKDSNTTTNPSMNNNNISAAEKQQQQQRAGTPPYTTQQKMDGRGDQKTAKQTQKTSKSVEPQGQKQQSSSSASNSKQKFTSTCGKEEAGKSTTKKRLYKSASTNEIFCAAGTQCKGYLNNNKALVALGHFNKALLNSDDFDYMKDRYQEEEDLLPDQIQHFLKHLSEGDKTALRLKEQMDKLEMLASPFNNKPDPFFEGLMKLSPEEADKAFVKAITYCAYEQDDDEDDDEEGNEQMDANQLEKRLSHVIRNKFCESCLKEGHFQFGKRETSESGCQTEFNPTRRKLREDDATLMMMQQLQQQQQLMGQPANDDYINALKNAFAAAQQQQGQPIAPDQANEDYLNALKYAAAQQNQPVSEASEEYMNALKSHAAFAAAAAAQQHQQQQNQPQMPIVPPEVEQEYMNALKSSHQAFAPSPRQQQQNQQPVPALPARRKKATAKKSLQQQQQQQSTQAQAQQQMQNYQQQNLLEQQQKLLEQQQQQFMQANELLKDENETLKAELMTLKSNDKKQSEQLAFVQKEFQNLNGKYEKLIQQLKDRKNEIKKLEKKAKSEAQLLTENQELLEKMEAMKKELGQAQRQLADEQAKYKRDTQSLADSKKHLSVELNSKYTEVQKLTTQFEEKGQAVKKLESQLANERKNNAQTITNLTERVKRAEVNLLEHKLEDGLRVLERAKEDCNAQIKVLEAEKQKRTSAAELEVVKKNIAEWESKREEVVQLIGQAKTDFQAHIQAVKSGKQLSQLPKIQVPKPPPCPKIHPMPQTIQATSVGPFQVVPQSPLTLERKVITPPNRTRIGAITPQQQGQQPQIATPSHIPPSPGIGIGPAHQFQPIGMTTPQPPTISHSQSANVTPVKGGGQFQHSPATMTSQPPPIGHVPPQPPSTIAPIGSRPSNYQNGISVPPPPHQSTPQQPHKFQMQSQPGAPGQHRQSPQMVPLMGQFQPTGPPPPTMHHPQFNIAPPSTATIGQPPHIQQQQAQQAAQQQNAGGGSYQTWNGGWGASGGSAGGAGDHLTNMNNIGDIFGQGRSFGPLGSDFGGGSQAIGGYRSASVTHQPPAGVIGPPGSNAATNPSSQPIGAGRNVQNVSPSQSQQNQQRNGWSTFSTDTWNPALSGRQN